MEKQKKPKRPRGRPVKPIDYAKVEALAARGMDKKHIAAACGMHYVTLNKKGHEDPELEAALERGLAAGISAVTGQLLKQINLGNMTGIIFYLKSKAGWKETSVVEFKDAMLELPDNCTPEEAAAAYMAAMRGK